MILWFAGGAVVAAWTIFHDPALDFRLIVLGALVPDAVDVWLGGARAFHSVTVGALVLAAVMAVTRHRRQRRRRLLALPIGMLLHLVLDGAWTRSHLFWWPFFGLSFGSASLPSLSRPPLVLVGQEVVGAVCLAWAWRRFRLNEPDRRARFWRTGYLGRDLVG